MDRLSFPTILSIIFSNTLFSGLWIFSSDQLLLFLIPNPQRLTQRQTYKGWVFVVSIILLPHLPCWETEKRF